MGREEYLLPVIYGILRSGAAYVPIDVHAPAARQQAIITDAELKVVIGRGVQSPELAADSHLLEIEALIAGITTKPIAGELPPVDSHSLAYVIYTSGTTGRPKGVMIEHHSVINRLEWMQKHYPLDSRDVILQKTPVIFDVSVWELFWWSFAGASVYLLEPGGEKDPAVISKAIREAGITTMHFVPTMLNPFLEYIEQEELSKTLKSLKQVFASGEALPASQVNMFGRLLQEQGTRLINLYGPTEATVDVSYYECELSGKTTTVPIGKPIDNTRLYVLDGLGQLCPIGMAGELCIAGVGLARGYLNNAELTEQKFTANPVNTRERIYHTGDLVRWLADGNIEYLGRMDHQVKIRGLRIELGDIESHVGSYPGISACVVMLIKDHHPYLAAYYTATTEVSEEGLGVYLGNLLPGYMVPGVYVRLGTMPLTATGKLDRKALPLPVQKTRKAGITAPQGEQELLLAGIWSQVLGVENPDREDDFFASGGDSIKSIQIISRLQRSGYKLSVKDIFSQRTIARLALQLEAVGAGSGTSQEQVKGAVILSPVQRWFLATGIKKKEQFNQSVLLDFPGGLERVAVDRVFSKLAEHHDALRMYFSLLEGPAGVKQQHCRETAAPLEIQEEELQGLSEEEVKARLEILGTALQSGMRLETGPLLKLGLYHMEDGSSLLLIAIHHLVVDGISWRILFEDIETLYNQYEKNETLILPAKTSSYQKWSREQQERISTAPISYKKNRAYWANQQSTASPAALPGLLSGAADRSTDTLANAVAISFRLDAAETAALLGRVHGKLGTEVNDLLLSGLLLALERGFGCQELLLDMEGHGREETEQGTDISRTVGWFTSIYPVQLSVSGDRLLNKVRQVKSQLRSVPRGGQDYLLYRYGEDHTQNNTDNNTNDPTNNNTNTTPQYNHPLVSFNYLGQFDADTQSRSYRMSAGPRGQEIATEEVRLYDWEFSGLVSGGELELSLRYGSRRYDAKELSRLMAAYRGSLQELIAAAGEYEGPHLLSPAELSYPGLGLTQLEALQEQYELEDIYGLSPMQEGMLFHALLDSSSDNYFEQMRLKISGELNITALQESLNSLAKRYAVLRTLFVHEGYERPLQVVLKTGTIAVEQEDLREINEEAQKDRVSAWQAADKARGFELSRPGGLMRVGVLQLAEDSYELIWSHHHILMDGWCMGIILNEFRQLYSSYVKGKPIKLSDTEPYSNYIGWLQEQDSKAALDYWKDYLKDYEGGRQLPVRRTAEQKEQKEPKEQKAPQAGEQPSYLQGSRELELSRDRTNQLQAICGRLGITLSTLLQGAWGLLLGRYHGDQDVVFGSVVSGRGAPVSGIETMVGLLINTIPVRVQAGHGTEGTKTIGELLQELQESALVSEAWHHCPLAHIQSVSKAGSQLFDHLMVFENFPLQIDQNEASAAERHDYIVKEIELFERTNYNFTLMVFPGETVKIKAEYDENTCDPVSVNQLLSQLGYILDQVSSDVDLKLSAICLLSEAESSALAAGFNATAAVYSEKDTLVSVLERQARLNPDQAAVKCGERILSYGELDQLSRQIGLYLKNNYGIQEGDLVGVLLGREEYLLPVIYGILRSGAAYVPIDVHAPAARQQAIITDAELKVVIGRGVQSPELAADSHLLEIEALIAGITTKPIAGELPPVDSHSLAYVIYTSGTTGRPKGVMIEHHSVINRLEWMQKHYPLDSRDVILQKTPVIFDVSVWELFWWSFAGASVYLLEPGGEKDPAVISKAIREAGITTMHFVPTMLNPFLEYIEQEELSKTLKSLKQVFASGEALPASQVNMFGRLLQEQGTRLINLYGPTEATVDVSYYECELSGKTTTVPIGKPIDNTRLYVLDGLGQLCPIGMAGELCIAGVGLARGYLNNAELTEQKFTANPVNTRERIYHTGDLVRWLADGNIEYLGRMDHQVKIRGLRIELGDIESHVGSYPGISACVVMLIKDHHPYLAAYYTATTEVSEEGLGVYLGNLLPGYMVPGVYVRLGTMPLTATGKLDRKALPLPIQKTRKAGITAPQGEQELLLAGIWSQVLGVEENTISVDDNFFILGGHSIKAIQLINEIYKKLAVRIKLSDIFSNPTLAQQSKLLNKSFGYKNTTLKRLENKHYYPISSAQERLFYEYLQKPDSLAYNISGAFTLEGQVDETRLQDAFQALIDRHESLRTSFTFSETGIVEIINPNVKLKPVLRNQEEFANVSQAFSSFVQPFNLSEAPLMRYSLLKGGKFGTVLFIDVHHIVCDGLSLNILINDFVKIYQGETLPPLNLRYVDYAAWQKDALKNIPEQISFWEQKLAGKLQKLDLPQEQNTEYEDISEASVTELAIDGDLYTALKSYSAVAGVSDFMLLLSFYYILLSKVSGNTDVIIGTDVVGRTHPELNNIVGTFINILPLRIQVDPFSSFDDFLQRVKSGVLQAFDNQDFQYDEMVTMLNKNGANTYDSIIDVHFAFANYIQDTEEIEGLKISPIKLSDVKTTQYGFKIEVFESDNRMLVQFIYSKALYSAEIITMLSIYYRNIMVNALKNSSVSIDEIELDSELVYTQTI